MDKALKQRLVGASVIIALAVIILPMLLSGRPQLNSQQSQKIELPPRPEELSFETRRFPISESAPSSQVTEEPEDSAFSRHQQESAGTSTLPVPEPAEENSAAEEQAESLQAQEPTASAQGAETDVAAAAVEQEAKPVATAPDSQTAPAVEPRPEAASPPASPSGRYVVQVASLGSAENASKLMTSLQDKGYPVLMDVVESDAGQLSRVRVGPYARESEAASTSKAIGSTFSGVSPRVLDLAPDESAPATASSDPLVRWVVQAGSFAESSNANRLVAQLQSEKMNAYSEAVRSSSSTVYRVRVGPFLERDEAIKTKQLISESLAIDGVVMSAD